MSQGAIAGQAVRTPTLPERWRPVFYYDLASPACYVMAEQISSALPVVVEWEPVMAGPVGGTEAQSGWTALQRLAGAGELQPLRRLERWPPDARTATLAATYAKRIGKGVAFSLAAFRQQFAAGRDLGDLDTVVIAAAACEIHPGAVLKAVGLRSVTDALHQAQRRAQAAAVTSLPAVVIGDAVLTSLDDAVAMLAHPYDGAPASP